VGNWRDSIPSNYLKASDVDPPKLFTISGFDDEKIGDEIKPVVKFKETTKGLVLNIVNGNKIEEITGSWDPKDWVGNLIVCFKSRTEFKGREVDCVRVRAPKPGAKIPEAPPEPAPEDDVPF
jgi:hypothetical protein